MSRGALPGVLLFAAGCGMNAGPNALAGTSDSAITSTGRDTNVDSAEPVEVDTGTLPMPPVDGMVAVEPGAFVMGCTTEGECFADELPAREVTLHAFYIDVAEVSQANWAACIAGGACAEPRCNYAQVGWDDYPVVCVSRGKAENYCAWLGKRLPTEAEWEKAARGSDGRRYPWGSAEPDCKKSNFMDCGNTMNDVGGHLTGQSPYGALDMAGNVGEWVSDGYAEDTYSLGDDVDPVGAGGPTGVWRGGNCEQSTFALRAWGRNPLAASTSSDAGVGFRCARDP